MPDFHRAVHYACAVCADLQVSRLPVDPFMLAQSAGITLCPFSSAMGSPGFFPQDLAHRLQMSCAVTLTYPAFSIVYRDDLAGSGRLRFALAHELGHLFMNHYRDYPGRMFPGSPADSSLEAEADAFARNLLAPVPLVDVIRYNRPRQARAEVFGLSRRDWVSRLDALDADRSFVDEDMANTLICLFHDYLLGRRCLSCGRRFKADGESETDVCPDCGAPSPDWDL